MFGPITIPYESKMLYNVVKLKNGISMEDVELKLGELCETVKETYRDEGGFIAGQAFKFSGFVSEEGSLDSENKSEEHIAIITYWKSFEQHEKSHADPTFKGHFKELMDMCDDAYEIGYDLLWQGVPE